MSDPFKVIYFKKQKNEMHSQPLTVKCIGWLIEYRDPAMGSMVTVVGGKAS